MIDGPYMGIFIARRVFVEQSKGEERNTTHGYRVPRVNVTLEDFILFSSWASLGDIFVAYPLNHLTAFPQARTNLCLELQST